MILILLPIPASCDSDSNSDSNKPGFDSDSGIIHNCELSVNVTNTCCCNYYRYWVGPLMTGIVLLLSTSGLISIVMYRLMIRYKYKRSQSSSDGTSSDSLISQLKELKASTLPGSYIVRNSIITAVVTLLFLSTLFHSVSTFTRGV